MIRIAIALAFLTTGAHAQSVKLEASEIAILLSGNTAVGAWGDTSYRQYFDPDGTTIYVEDGVNSALGEWRVSEDSYQSIWSGDIDWSGWFVMEFSGDFYWVSKTTPPTPFSVVDGQQLATQ
jgi:hypothetical protein